MPPSPSTSKPGGRRGPSWTLINFLLDTLLLVVFLALCWTTLALRFVFPPASESAGWTLWGLRCEQWGDVQFTLLSVMALAVLVHLMLHWTWICGFVTSHFFPRRDGRKRTLDDGSRTLYGVALLIALLHVLGALLAAAAWTVRGPA